MKPICRLEKRASIQNLLVRNTRWVFVVLFLILIQKNDICAQTNCGSKCSYDFIEKNDTIAELKISINGLSRNAYFYKSIDDNIINLPKFQGRYKDCLLFMLGNGQHYRLLIVFQAINGKIIRSDYEHTMCMKPDIKERYLFFYDEHPIEMIYNYKNSKVKFKKLKDDKKYKYSKGNIIESCQNRLYVTKEL